MISRFSRVVLPLLFLALAITTTHPLTLTSPNFEGGTATLTSREAIGGPDESRREERTPIERVPLSAPSPITNYTIDAILLDGTHTVTATTSINYVNHAGVSLDELVFHLYPNAFDSTPLVTIVDVLYLGASLSYTVGGSDMTILTVDLSTPGPGSVADGNNVTLDLLYQVEVPEGASRFGWYNETDSENPDFYTYQMGNWHPIVAVYDDRGWHMAPYAMGGESFYQDPATYDVNLTVPEDFVVAATGELQGITSGSGTRTWHWTTGPVRDFTWCASPDFLTTSSLVEGVNITSYYLSDHSAEGELALEVAEACIPMYSDLFGPYHWETFQVVETQIGALGMEYPQLIMLDIVLYGGSYSDYLEVVTAHEIGHEWIPYMVGTDSHAEPWIDEGFASFTEYVFLEYEYDYEERQDYRSYDIDYYWSYVSNYGDDCINHSMDYWDTNDGYYAYVYVKGPLVYDMLRIQVGNQTFYEACQYIYDHALHRNIRASDFQTLFEAAVGYSLAWFFDQWVFSSGVVTLSLDSVNAAQVGTNWTLTFNILQDQPQPIALWVPIQVVTEAGSEFTSVWMDAMAVNTYSLSFSSFPRRVILDPESYLLCQYRIQDTIPFVLLIQYVAIAVIIIILIVVIAYAIIRYRRRHRS
ncbi:MAG: M1 family metallopeptidase [Promethearchaeota archaeon]